MLDTNKCGRSGASSSPRVYAFIIIISLVSNDDDESPLKWRALRNAALSLLDIRALAVVDVQIPLSETSHIYLLSTAYPKP